MSYNKMESSDATANTIRYGKWKALGRVSTEPSVEAKTGKTGHALYKLNRELVNMLTAAVLSFYSGK